VVAFIECLVREFADPPSQRYSESFREQAAWQAKDRDQRSKIRNQRVDSKKIKRLTASTVSIRQALNY
jgi:hypothetical protein